jgi:hypothetical protein
MGTVVQSIDFKRFIDLNSNLSINDVIKLIQIVYKDVKYNSLSVHLKNEYMYGSYEMIMGFGPKMKLSQLGNLNNAGISLCYSEHNKIITHPEYKYDPDTVVEIIDKKHKLYKELTGYRPIHTIKLLESYMKSKNITGVFIEYDNQVFNVPYDFGFIVPYTVIKSDFKIILVNDKQTVVPSNSLVKQMNIFKECEEFGVGYYDEGLYSFDKKDMIICRLCFEDECKRYKQFFPCNHSCVCDKCYDEFIKKFNSCPICQTFIYSAKSRCVM